MFTSFHLTDSGLYLLICLIFILIYFESRDAENQHSFKQILSLVRLYKAQTCIKRATLLTSTSLTIFFFLLQEDQQLRRYKSRKKRKDVSQEIKKIIHRLQFKVFQILLS